MSEVRFNSLGGYSLLKQIGQECHVSKFMLSQPNIALTDIEKILHIISSIFSSPTGETPVIECTTEEEPQGLALFLCIKTQDMDFDEQLKREKHLRDFIWTDAGLRNAKKNIVISVY